MSVEKLVQLQESSSEIFDSLIHAWIAEGFSLKILEREERLMVCELELSPVEVEFFSKVIPAKEGCLVYIQCGPKKITQGSDSGQRGMPGEGAKAAFCVKTIHQVLERVGQWQEVSPADIGELANQLQDMRENKAPAQSQLSRMGVWLGLFLMIAGSLLSFLTARDVLDLVTPQVWIMLSVIGVFVFCFGLFSLIWRK